MQNDPLHQKLDWLKDGLRYLALELRNMTKMHDDLKAKTVSNEDIAARNLEMAKANAAKLATLIGLKESHAAEGESANQDVLDALASHEATLKEEMQALQDQADTLDKAIASHQDSSSGSTSASSSGGFGSSTGSWSSASSGSSSSSGSATIQVPVTDETAAGTTTIPISGDTIHPVGSIVTGPGIPIDTTVAPGTTADSLVLSNPTTADHSGDEVLTITPAPSPVPDANLQPDATGFTPSMPQSSGAQASAQAQSSGADLGPNPSSAFPGVFSPGGKLLKDGNGG